MEKRKSLKNQRKMNKKNITMKQYGLKDKAKTNIVETFMGILNMVKLYHWKTYSYAKHQATDELYMKLNKDIDEFVEVMLGKDESRIPNFKTKIILQNDNSENTFKKNVYQYRDSLLDMDNILSETSDSDLKHIRDNILADINQFLYLLTFNK